jgi:ABC-type nitrate/sulfonate/bicarbonate transport system permease component
MSIKKNLIVLFIIIFIWLILTYFKIVKPIFLPNLFDVILSLKYLLFTKEGILNILFTLKRTIISFIIGSIIGIIFGVILGAFRSLYDYFEGFINFFRSVPATAMFPLFMIFFGFGDLVKIVIGVWASCFVVLINTVHGVWNAKKNRIIMAKIKNANKYQIIRKIMFFESLPYIFAGMRIGFSWNLIVIIVIEMFIGGKYGIGKYIYDSSILLNTASVIGGIIIIGSLGIFFNYLILKIENKVIHWRGF